MAPMPPKASAPGTDEKTVSAEQVATVPPEPRAGSGDGPNGGLTSRPGWRRRKKGRASWRWRAVALLTLVLLVAGAGRLALALSQRGASPQRPTGRHARASPLTAEAVARRQAVSWILHQVSPAEIVTCDTQICGDLASSGFPSSNLLPLGPVSNDTLGTDLVVATATVRNQFGSHLAVWAPAIIASFGTGNTRIDIRWAYPGGAKAYRGTLRAARRGRKAAYAELLTNSSIKLSATAKSQLLSGQVDPQLPLLLAIMAHSHPLQVVGFAGQSPGGGPASLLRWMDLATTVRVSHLTRTAYLRWMLSFIGAQRAEYLPDWIQQVTLPEGQAVLRIGYGAPSPLSYPRPGAGPG
jgi:hypothetical protein